jgi:hypothetical protein
MEAGAPLSPPVADLLFPLGLSTSPGDLRHSNRARKPKIMDVIPSLVNAQVGGKWKAATCSTSPSELLSVTQRALSITPPLQVAEEFPAEAAVGKAVRVYWPDEKDFFRGTVKGYRCATRPTHAPTHAAAPSSLTGAATCPDSSPMIQTGGAPTQWLHTPCTHTSSRTSDHGVCQGSKFESSRAPTSASARGMRCIACVEWSSNDTAMSSASSCSFISTSARYCSSGSSLGLHAHALQRISPSTQSRRVSREPPVPGT